MAYLHYRNGDYDLAVRALEQAGHALRLAIGAACFPPRLPTTARTSVFNVPV